MKRGHADTITVVRNSLDLDDAQFGINADAIIKQYSSQLDPAKPVNENVERNRLTFPEILAKHREQLPDIIVQSIRNSVGPLGEVFPLTLTPSISWVVQQVLKFKPQPAELSVLNTAPRVASFEMDSMAGRLEFMSQGFIMDAKALDTPEGVRHYNAMMRQFLSNFYLTLAEQLRRDFLTQPDFWFAPEKRFRNSALANAKIEDVMARRALKTLAVTRFSNGILSLIDDAEMAMQTEGEENLPVVIFTTRETRRSLAIHDRNQLIYLTQGPTAIANRRKEVIQVRSRNRTYALAASPLTPGDEARKYNSEAPLMGELVTGMYDRFRNSYVRRPDCETNGYKTWFLIEGLLGDRKSVV